MPSNKKLLQAAAGNAGESLYVEDVFSTYLYTGTNSAMTITNGIDLDGEGGLVWIKNRTTTLDHVLGDTERGVSKGLRSNSTDGNLNYSEWINGFNSNGFSVGASGNVSDSNNDYASWTFRKAEKFFDVVTYTGDGNATKAISHNLGSTPGFIVVKRTNGTGYWIAGHNSDYTKYLMINETNGFQTWTGNWNATDSAFTAYSSGNASFSLNNSGDTYVAYLFASDAGGFGDDGDENIIKCGSYTGSGGSGQEINLGFEPQWVLVKNTSRAGQNWVIVDNMRQFDNTGYGWLYPNSSAAETSGTGAVYASPTATGFKTYGNNAAFDYLTDSYIYVAIRRPMKTPESGTEVFGAIGGPQTNGFPTGVFSDASIVGARSGSDKYYGFSSRLTGTGYLNTTSTGAENSSSGFTWDRMTGFWEGSWPSDYFGWSFKRATGFMDVVCYTGTGSAHTETHNLGVVPECMIVKRRDGASSWITYWDALGATKGQFLDTNQAFTSSSYWNDTAPTATQLTLGSGSTNNSGATFIAYLFATVAGVSKVGSYTGTGADLNVDCGFSAGARFVLIKRTDSSGDWYVWDTERGIVAGNDPYLLLNSSAAQVTNTDYIDPLSSGFTVTSSAPAALNASGGTYIFLAIA